MKQLLEWDPFNLKERKKFKMCVMYILYAGTVAIVLSLFLYLLLSVFTDRSAKLSELHQKVKTWEQRDDFKLFSELTTTVKIMPSQNTKGNMIVLKQKTDISFKEKKIQQLFNFSELYFFHQNTTLYFPALHFHRENVPAGDSENYCIHIYYAAIENIMLLELYESVKEFPDCVMANNPKTSWYTHDPKTGVDFFTWRQETRPLTGCNTRETCQAQCDKFDGIAKKKLSKEYNCYTYIVLTDVCMLIEYNTTLGWVYRGGCFENGSPLRYEKAYPGTSYKFQNIGIQVRSVHDPVIVATRSSTGGDQYSLGANVDFFYTLAFLLFFLSILCGVVVASAVILKEYIVNSKIFVIFFREGEGENLQLST